MARTRVFFDMTADGAPVGKIIMEVSKMLVELLAGIVWLYISVPFLAWL